MSTILTPFLALLFALPAQAQHVQTGSFNAATQTYQGSWALQPVYQLAFAKPVTSPCTLIVTVRGNGFTLSDSQQNKWATVPGLTSGIVFYSTTCAGGADTLTISCPNQKACYLEVTYSEYAGTWVPDQVSPEITDFMSGEGWTAPITPTQDGELILGVGSNHTTNSPGITPAAGWTLRANANQFLVDMVQAKAATIYSEVTYSTVTAWCQTTISWKPATPQPFTYTIPGCCTLTFPIASTAKVPTCSAADGVCAIVIQVCDLKGNCLSSNAGTLSLIKTASLPTPQTSATPVVTAVPNP